MTDTTPTLTDEQREILSAWDNGAYFCPRQRGRCNDRCAKQHDDIYSTVARMVADAGARALREAADKWQWGEWTVLTAPIKAASQPQRIIGAAQAVTDWLRDRADRIGGAR